MKKVLLFLLLFSVGIGAGLGSLWQFGSTGSRDRIADEDDGIALRPPEPDAAGLEQIEKWIRRGEAHFTVGNFSQASASFRQALDKLPFPPESLKLRLAASAEFSENYLLAAEIYEKVAKTSVSPIRQEFAQQGLVRVWQKSGRKHESFRVASDMFLQSEASGELPPELQAQALFEYVEVMLERALENYHFDLYRSNGVVFHRPGLDPLLLIDWLAQAQNIDISINSKPASSTTPADQNPDSEPDVPSEVDVADKGQPAGIRLVQAVGPKPEIIIVSVETLPVSLQSFFEELARVSGTRISMSARAQKAIMARSKAFHISRVSLAVLLDAVLLPLDLAWEATEENGIAVIQILDFSELGSDEIPNIRAKEEFWLAATNRIIRQFMLRYSNDERNDSLVLSQGNLSTIRGDIELASNQYETVLQRRPRGELLAAVKFNQAKVNVIAGRVALAIEDLEMAAYQTYDTSVKSAGFWLIGELFMELLSFEPAIQNSYQSLQLAETPKQKQLAALTLAKGYLLNSDPVRANQVLAENSKYFKGSKLRLLATALQQFSQYIGVEDRRSRETAEERLIYVLSQMRIEDVPTALDRYLVGRAFQELGFIKESIKYLELAADAKDGTVAKNQIQFALAIQKIKLGQEQDAGKMLSFLLKTDKGIWGTRAGIRLAELYLDNKMFDECIQISEQLLRAELSELEQRKVLRQMGFAYRGLKRHKTATLCFAGLHDLARKRRVDNDGEE